jgi:hypothetical protein
MNPMKIVRFSFLALAITGYVTSQAQSARIQGGINLANVSVTGDGQVDEAKTLTSFNAGLITDIPLGGFVSLQPGLLFTGKGTRTQSGDPNSANYYKATTNPYYLEVPVNLVFKLPVGKDVHFFAGAGPYAAIGIAGKNKVEGKYLGIGFNSEESIRFSNDDPTTTNYEEGAGFGILKRFDYGLNGTAGFEGKAMTISAGYGLGLAKLQSGSNSSNNEENKHRVWSFSLGFKL